MCRPVFGKAEIGCIRLRLVSELNGAQQFEHKCVHVSERKGHFQFGRDSRWKVDNHVGEPAYVPNVLSFHVRGYQGMDCREVEHEHQERSQHNSVLLARTCDRGDKPRNLGFTYAEGWASNGSESRTLGFRGLGETLNAPQL